jgi:hypothetical protein
MPAKAAVLASSSSSQHFYGLAGQDNGADGGALT